MESIAFHIWEYIYYAGVALAVIAVLWVIGTREWLGSKVARLLPSATLRKGDKAHIYLNGKYNRTATLSKVAVDAVYIYDDNVKLPLNFRGRFYGYGVDAEDGSCVVYIPKHSYYRLIRVAEIIRKVFNLADDDSNLNPDYSDDEQLTKQTAEEGAEDDEM